MTMIVYLKNEILLISFLDVKVTGALQIDQTRDHHSTIFDANTIF